jgi:hypothetical protein
VGRNRFAINLGRQPLSAIWLAILLTLSLVVQLAACGSPWEVTAYAPAGTAFEVNTHVLQGLYDFAEEVDGSLAVPLERVLVAAGHSAVERLVVVETDGTRSDFQWAVVADEAWWLNNGRLSIKGEELAASRLEIQSAPLLERVQASLTAIAPTAAAALGLPAPARATGRALEVPRASRLILIFLDGFGYIRYSEALRDGLIPNIAALGEPLVGLTTYPPSTNVATASLLAGAPPEVHGVNQRGIRKTEAETLFDVAAAAGRQIVAVEGESLAFELRNAEMKLSGDLDGNGSTDDNVLANALGALRSGMPDIFFVHFHGIDDAGHTYGPGAPEECAAITQEDAAVGQLVELLPLDTLIIIFGDHGMHNVEEGGRLGNHAHLVGLDMFIPIFVVSK